MTPIVPTRARLKEARVLVVGDSMLDRYWFGAVERISPEAPVPVVRVNTRKEQERLGGAANVAWNVKALGAHPSLLTAIGDDEHGGRLEKLLEKSGIETLFNRDPRLTTDFIDFACSAEIRDLVKKHGLVPAGKGGGSKR